jgi:hypothetical protein
MNFNPESSLSQFRESGQLERHGDIIESLRELSATIDNLESLCQPLEILIIQEPALPNRNNEPVKPASQLSIQIGISINRIRNINDMLRGVQL